MRWQLAFVSLAMMAGCGAAGSDVDAGPSANDAGVTERDAGDVLLDSGTEDAGTTVFDAGLGVVDAGFTVVDAGTSPVDAGSPYLNTTTADVMGPYATTTVTGSVTRGNRKTPVVVHLPTGLGAAPMIVFLPGASLSTSMYLPTVERLASHGFVVVRADPSFALFPPTDHAVMMADVKAVIDWVLVQSALAPRIDPTRIAVAGHSLGGKLAIMTAFADPRVKAVFGIDPVNAQSPDVVPAQVSGLAIPMGFAGETIDATGTLMACAPASGNYTTFYDAATSATWSAEWTFANTNHMDFVDSCSGFTCGVCNDASGDASVSRASLRILAVAFFRLHFRAESAMSAWLTGVSVPAQITTRHR